MLSAADEQDREDSAEAIHHEFRRYIPGERQAPETRKFLCHLFTLNPLSYLLLYSPSTSADWSFSSTSASHGGNAVVAT